jgi:hypothetical protein
MSTTEIVVFVVLFGVIAGAVIYGIITRRQRPQNQTDRGAIAMMEAMSPNPPEADGASEVTGLTVQEWEGGVAVRRYRPRKTVLPGDAPRTIYVQGQDGTNSGQQQVNGGQQGQQAQAAPAVPNFQVLPGDAGQMVVRFPGGAPPVDLVLIQWSQQGANVWAPGLTLAPNANNAVNIGPAGNYDVRVAVVQRGQMSPWSQPQQVAVAAPQATV